MLAPTHRIPHFPRTKWPDVDLWFSDTVGYVNRIPIPNALILIDSILTASDILYRVGPIPSHKMIKGRLAEIQELLVKAARLH